MRFNHLLAVHPCPLFQGERGDGADRVAPASFQSETLAEPVPSPSAPLGARASAPLSERPEGPDAGALRLARLKARRRYWLQAHLWLGLFAGAVLAVIGLTGSLLVFWQEIDEALNPDLMTVAIPAEQTARRPLPDIEAAVESALSEGALPGYGLYFPRHERGAFAYWYGLPNAQTGETESHTLFIDPYTAKVKGDRRFYSSESPFGHCLIGFVFKLHYGLLLKKPGVVLVGLLGVLLLVSVLTGLIVWWPLTGKWKQALTFKRRASPERRVFDLHKISGFYTAPILGAVLLSGVYMNLPDPFVWLVRQFSPNTPAPDAPKVRSAPAPGAAPIGLAAAAAIAERHTPGGELRLVGPPESATGFYAAHFINVPGLSRFWSEREVRIDPYTGAILEVRSPDTRRTAGETFLDWQWPLHSGQAFGWTGRLLVFLTGLACPVLYVTGVLRWLHKRRAGQGKTRSAARTGAA
jgi:uncharacterized iron-regulated membrane protein